MKKCLRCGGIGQAMGMGFMKIDCSACQGTGFIKEVSYEKQDDGKQNEVESSKDAERESDVDQSASDYIEGERQEFGESDAMGAGAAHLSERKESRKGRKEK